MPPAAVAYYAAAHSLERLKASDSIEHMFDSRDVTPDRNEQAAVLALVDAAGSEWPWHRIADAVSDVGSAIRIIEGSWSGFESDDA